MAIIGGFSNHGMILHLPTSPEPSLSQPLIGHWAIDPKLHQAAHHEERNHGTQQRQRPPLTKAVRSGEVRGGGDYGLLGVPPPLLFYYLYHSIPIYKMHHIHFYDVQ